jgi:hypothetical protein
MVPLFRAAVSLKGRPTYYSESNQSYEERNVRFVFRAQGHSFAFSSRAGLKLKHWKLYHCKSLHLYRSSPDKFPCPPRQWRAARSRISQDWPGCHFLCNAKEIGLPFVFVVELVRAAGIEPAAQRSAFITTCWEGNLRRTTHNGLSSIQAKGTRRWRSDLCAGTM